MQTHTIRIPPEQIRPNPQQPRTYFNEDELALLGRSMADHGQQQPILVEETGDGYLLIAGERRWRAARAVGLPALTAVVRPASAETADHDRLLLAMIENLHRSEMGPIDVARGWQQLIDEHGYDIERVAAEFGRNPVTVANHLGWLELEPEIQDLVNRGRLPRNHKVRQALLSIPSAQARVKLAQAAAEKNLTLPGLVRACKILAEQLKQAAGPSAEEEPVPALRFTGTDRSIPPRGWGALQETGQTPPWPFAVAAIVAACRACAWGDQAAPEICRECPVVVLVKYLARPPEAPDERP